ncbi:MAG: hypothetical protein RMJ54_15260 [Roseiflexaceae bacterium]|nr:hypothetical protein [Roseiflexaceae bacterium]
MRQSPLSRAPNADHATGSFHARLAALSQRTRPRGAASAACRAHRYHPADEPSRRRHRPREAARPRRPGHSAAVAPLAGNGAGDPVRL